MTNFTDDEIIQITDNYIEMSQSYVDDKLGPERRYAMDSYLQEKYGNEIDGRSQITTSDVQDTIEWVLPSLIRVFLAGEDVVDFQPVTDEDKEAAEHAKAWANHVIQRENNGFLFIHDLLKDGLLEKTGVGYAGWQEQTRVIPETHGAQSKDELEALEEREDFTIREKEVMPIDQEIEVDGEIITTTIDFYNVKGSKKETTKKIELHAFPPEEFLTLAETTSVPDGGDFHAIRRKVSISRLRSWGYDVPDDISGDDIVYGSEETRESRRKADSNEFDDYEDDISEVDRSARKVWFYLCWVLIDMDGDGIAEWWQIARTGDTILDKEQVVSPTVYAWSPVRMAHRWVGRSLADLVVEIQKLKTTLNRQILDYLYLTVNPRTAVATGSQWSTPDTIDDVLDNAIGGVVRELQPGAVRPLPQSPIAPETFSYLEYWEGQREVKTGVPRINQGLNPDTINKTASGILSIMNSAQTRVELIARLFAETMFKPLVQGILQLTTSFPEELGEKIIRATGRQLKITAESIEGNYDLIVNVGLGNGNKEQMLIHLQTLWQKQLEMMQIQGQAGSKQVVALDQLYNTVVEMAKNMGFRSAQGFFDNPETAQDIPPPAPPPEDPAITAAKIKAEVDMAELQFKREIELEKLQLQAAELGVKIGAGVKESQRANAA